MKREIIGILVITLLIATAVLPVTGIINNNNNIIGKTVNPEGDLTSFTLGKYTPLNPVLEWEWTGSIKEPNHDGVISTPLVGDLDWDLIPEIVFISYDCTKTYKTDGILRAIKGDNSGSHFDITNPNYRVSPLSTPAIGDINRDNGFEGMEIVALAENYTKLYAFKQDGSLWWTSDEVTDGPMLRSAAIAIADLDLNNDPEIIVGNKVFDSSGNLIDEGIKGRGRDMSCIADVDLDGKPEIIAGNTIYGYDPSAVYPKKKVYVEEYEDPFGQTKPDGFNAIGDFPGMLIGSNYPDIVLVKRGIYNMNEDIHVFLLDTILNIFGIIDINNYGGGPPTIDDFNGDGLIDISVTSATKYHVLTFDPPYFQTLWTADISDSSSGYCGSTVYDFNNDGIKDVIFRDEKYLYVFNGQTGQSQCNPIDCTSYTGVDMPVVADVDYDYSAEIIVPCNRYPSTSTTTGIKIFGGNNWIYTRSIWNQHTYHITNIGINGYIPAIEPNNWQFYNNYRIQDNFNPHIQEAHIIGPAIGEPGIEYIYTISAIHPDGKDVCYWIEWDDGTDKNWLGPYPSGEEVQLSHIWLEKGKYSIRLKAFGQWGGESNWATLEVSIPKNKMINISFLQFLDNHPHLFSILRQILEL